MSLKQCPECKGPMSTFAESCPHCGFSPKKYAEIIAKKAQKLEEEQRETIAKKAQESAQTKQHDYVKQQKSTHSVRERYEDDEIITLEFEDNYGNIEEVETGMMGVFECDGKEYVALEVLDESGDVLIYGYKEVGDDEFELVDIEDDAEYAMAAAVFDEIMTEEE